MNWKRWSVGMSVVGVLMGSAFAGSAFAQSAVPDVVLYEVTEAVTTKGGNRPTGFRSSTATLAGVARSGVAACPEAIATPALNGCWVVVRAVGRADDSTGKGHVVGSFEVLIQDRNQTDSPEIVVLRGNVGAQIDLSPAFERNVPTGTISGSFRLRGVPGTVMEERTVKGEFTGVFRMPFMVYGQAMYVIGDPLLGQVSVQVPVQAAEYVLGSPAVKLEVTFR
jgi:hypothetical protein